MVCCYWCNSSILVYFSSRHLAKMATYEKSGFDVSIRTLGHACWLSFLFILYESAPLTKAGLLANLVIILSVIGNSKNFWMHYWADFISSNISLEIASQSFACWAIPSTSLSISSSFQKFFVRFLYSSESSPSYSSSPSPPASLFESGFEFCRLWHPIISKFYRLVFSKSVGCNTFG